MTKKSQARLFLAIALAASAQACGDDDDDGGNNGTAGISGSSTATAGRAGAGTSGSGTSGSSAQAGRGGSANAAGSGGDAGAAVGGAAGEGGLGGEAGAGGAAGGGGEGGAAIASLSDAQILLVLDTVNQGEVEEAYAALPHLVVPGIEAFAQQMITDHSAARQQVLAVVDALDVVPQPSELQAMLKAKGEQEVAEYQQSQGDALDETYITAEVAEHAEVLALLSELDDTADAPELKTLIGGLQTTVQDHLDEAVDLQDALP